MNDTKDLYKTALGQCTEVTDVMKTVSDKADELVKREDWD